MTLCEITGATEEMEIIIAYPLDWQTCMRARGASHGRHIVLCRVKEEQQTQFMNYGNNRRGRGECRLFLPGRLELWLVECSIPKSGAGRGVLRYNLHLRHALNHKCDLLSLCLGV